MNSVDEKGAGVGDALRRLPRLRPRQVFDRELHARLLTEHFARRRAAITGRRPAPAGTREIRGALGVALRPRFALAGAAAGIIALAWAGVLYRERMPRPMQVAVVQGRAVFTHGPMARLVEAGMEIPPDSELVTFGNARVDIRLADAYEVRVAGEAKLRVSALPRRPWARSTELHLASGTLFTRSLHAGAEGALHAHPLQITTPDAVVRPLGTIFAVTVRPSIRTRVAVLDGHVLVEPPDARPGVVVEPGHFTEAWSGVADLVSLPMAGTGDDLRAGLRAFARREVFPEPSAALETEPYLRRDPTVYLDIGRSSVRVARLFLPCDILTNIESPAELREMLDQSRYFLKMGQVTGASSYVARSLDLLEKILDRFPDPAYNVELELWRAAHLFALQRPQEALGALDHAEELVNQDGDLSGQALQALIWCAKGKLYEESLGDPVQARQWYRRVVERGNATPEFDIARARIEQLAGRR